MPAKFYVTIRESAPKEGLLVPLAGPYKTFAEAQTAKVAALAKTVAKWPRKKPYQDFGRYSVTAYTGADADRDAAPLWGVL